MQAAHGPLKASTILGHTYASDKGVPTGAPYPCVREAPGKKQEICSATKASNGKSGPRIWEVERKKNLLISPMEEDDGVHR